MLTVGFSLHRGRLSFCVLASSGVTVKNKSVLPSLCLAWFPGTQPSRKSTFMLRHHRTLGSSLTSGTTEQPLQCAQLQKAGSERVLPEARRAARWPSGI
ncbi:hypothetical protein PAL_GLEAN10012588 [Pteropus alecto]|uniref:Uncharacterized protein n=1 Tax=Pteropus alecto TaxID=9402 RepID=L5K7H1_PTEAL|nr:hypothetical protein PAL_GLEAN10012588 [Pteropus alecto]